MNKKNNEEEKKKNDIHRISERSFVSGIKGSSVPRKRTLPVGWPSLFPYIGQISFLFLNILWCSVRLKKKGKTSLPVATKPGSK
ncbi:hypothetical protein TNCV_4632011 [Trichonephila clavipes]|nr:hypothetical protein TNCV_4632011 [Trichonephila clavipes]